MTKEQQDNLRKVLYNAKFTTDANDENPFVGIYFNDLLDIIRDFGRQRNQWKPVEEELPKHDVEENGLITYQEVLVRLYDGYVTIDTYDTERKAWWQYDGEVEYCVPLPEAHRKEE